MALKNILKREISKQFLRFAIVGLACATLTYLIFILSYYFLTINYLISATLGIVAGVSFGFGFNKKCSFNSKKRNVIALPKYILVYVISWLFNLVALKFLVESKGLNPIPSNLIILPIIVAINFFGIKIFAFQNKNW